MKRNIFFIIILIGITLFSSLSYAYAQEPMIGEVRMWAGASPGSQPFSGWFVADGRAVSRTTYADLFSMIGTTYGVGDGSTTFNLPNFTSKFPQGATSSPGGTGGEASHTLTVNEMPQHRHQPDWPYRFMVESNSSGTPGDKYDGGSYFFYDYTGYTSYAGGGQAHNNLPPYLDIYFIIYAGAISTPTPTDTPTPTPTNTPTPTPVGTPACPDGQELSTLTTGLSAHWRLNEANGTRYDAHNNFDLLDNNAVGQATGKIDTAASLVITNSQYLSLTNASAFSPGNNPFAVAAWVKPSIDASGGVVGKYVPASGDYGYNLFYTYTTEQFTFALWNDLDFPEVSIDAINSAPPDTWHFIAAWSAGDYIYLQLNDGPPLQTTNTITNFNESAPFVVGAMGSTSDGYPWFLFDGEIDSVSFWDRALTTTETGILYNSGLGLDYPFCVTSPLPYSVYTYTLTSDQVLAVPVYVSFGEALITGSLLLLSMVFVIKMMFRGSS